MMRVQLLGAAALVAAFALPSISVTAGAAGRPEEGQAIAERWCSSCHQVSDQPATVTTEAPPFPSIAMKYPDDEGHEALRAFLSDPHPLMPDMSLTRQEILDLIAYIDSL